MSESQNDEIRVYELCFHIVPNIPEEEVQAQFEAVKKIISDKEGTTFISEGLPILRTLAYAISKTVKAVKTNYTQAYFGWVKFIASPEQIEEIKKAVDEMPSIIRYLMVLTVRENTLMSKMENGKESTEEKESNGDLRRKDQHQIPADIDKTIDELVVQ